MEKEEEKEYFKFIQLNGIFPESKFQSMFSGIAKNHSFGICPNCKYSINQYFFNFFIDQIIYLDGTKTCRNFSDILRRNLDNSNILEMICQKCGKQIQVREETKIIKLPEILIFTLQSSINQHCEKVFIEPIEKIDLRYYIDHSLNIHNKEFELYSINIRWGLNNNDGHEHEICQVKRNGEWYEIDDTQVRKIHNIYNDFNKYIYGLFYNLRVNY